MSNRSSSVEKAGSLTTTYLSSSNAILNNATITEGKVTSTKATVTQGTSITTAVTCNAPSGVITTFSAAITANSSATFTVNNAYCVPSSVVVANICNYAGSQGIPSIVVKEVTTGNFKIVVYNAIDATAPGAPLNGVIKVAFIIV